MKHTLILSYRNLSPDDCPLIRFNDAIAVPVEGEEVSYGPNSAAKVLSRYFIVKRDEIRIILRLEGEGLAEGPSTDEAIS